MVFFLKVWLTLYVLLTDQSLLAQSVFSDSHDCEHGPGIIAQETLRAKQLAVAGKQFLPPLNAARKACELLKEKNCTQDQFINLGLVINGGRLVLSLDDLGCELLEDKKVETDPDQIPVYTFSLGKKVLLRKKKNLKPRDFQRFNFCFDLQHPDPWCTKEGMDPNLLICPPPPQASGSVKKLNPSAVGP